MNESGCGRMGGSWEEIDNGLLNPEWYGDRDRYVAGFARLRAEDPVHWTENDSFGRHHWTLSRYSDVSDYLTNDRLFSSRWDTRAPNSPERRTPEVRHAQGWDVSISAMDNPLHNVYRRPVNKHFSAPMVAKMADSIRATVDGIIREVGPTGSCDFVAEVAGELPVRVIMSLLGVPESDWEKLRRATSRWRTPADPRWMIDNDRIKTFDVGITEVLDYCSELAQSRRREPKDDFATLIGTIRVDGDLLSLHEIKTWFSVIIAAGLETTRNAAAVGTWLFITHPDQRELLAATPGLVGSAVDEVLRWVSPSRTRLRICNEDTEFGGQKMHSGDWVIGLLGSANLDESVFDDPLKFDITRSPNEHLGFGKGIHGCLGRNLARLELKTLFSRLFTALPDLTLAPDAAPYWIPDYNVTGFSSMKVEYTPVDTATR